MGKRMIRTKEYYIKCKSSHVDWWLYETAQPWDSFELINDFTQHLTDMESV